MIKARFKIDNVFHDIEAEDIYLLMTKLDEIQDLYNFLNMAYCYGSHDELDVLRKMEGLLHHWEEKTLTEEEVSKISIHHSVGDIECVSFENE